MEKSHTHEQPSLGPIMRRWSIVVVSTAALSAAQATALFFWHPWLSAARPTTIVPQAPTAQAVTALGRLEPKGGTLQLSTSNSAQGNRVAQLLVKQGDKVRVGQVVAILDNCDRLLIALEQARQQVKVAQARLDQVRAGAKAGEITAGQANVKRLQAELRGDIDVQSATLARLEAELHNAQTEYQRYQGLYQGGAVSASSLDSKQLAVETVQKQVDEAKANLSRTKNTLQEQTDEAKATLSRIQDVRPVDVQVEQSQVDNAKLAVRQAQANLDSAYVRAPVSGQVLKIHTWPGEVASNQGQGIIELGQTQQMYAVAEVYESDIGKVHLGQRATIVSEGNTLSRQLHGTVEQIGLQIGKQDVLNTDPAADVDARVVEVKVLLDKLDSQGVSGLTNMKVTVLIHI